MIVGGHYIDGVVICDLGEDRQELVSHRLKSRKQRWAEGEKYMELVSFDISGIREVGYSIKVSDIMGKSNGSFARCSIKNTIKAGGSTAICKMLDGWMGDGWSGYPLDCYDY